MYAEYLRLDQVLTAQQLFIIIHQVYELWFKEVLHELDYLRGRLDADDLPKALGTFKRVLTILKVMVSQIDVLETMTPIDYLTFRDRLESGSGFQSAQFREFEFVLGAKRRAAVDHFPEGGVGRAALERRFHEPTLWDAFVHYLARAGYPVPEDVLGRDVTQPIEASPGLQRVLVDLYRSDPSTLQLCERLIDLDEGVQEWRYRHVKMVQRTIGTKRGTGGSSGAEYLKSTLFHNAFPDLWIIRTEL
jgi:tryptophan 2,3-dioxygenase